MKVALIRSPEVIPYWYITKPSLGICYLSSYLKSRGINTEIFDAKYDSWTVNQTVEMVVKYCPDIIGISAMTHETNKAHNIIASLKNKYFKIYRDVL
jgi:hypothetical protein